MAKEKNIDPQVEDAEVVQAPASPGLDLNDLALALNLVNVAIKRGAYERSELRNVLDVTDKLDVFLQYQANAQKAAQAGKGEA
jgi:hypothetical protein